MPGSTDIATFIGPADAGFQPVVTADAAVGGLNFSGSTSTGYLLGSANGATLTLSSSGTGDSAAINSANSLGTSGGGATAWDNVIAAPLLLTGATPVIRATSTAALTLNGPISSAGSVALTLEGRINLNGASTYAGTTTLPLYLGIGNPRAFGNSYLRLASGVLLTATTDLAGPNRLTNPITFASGSYALTVRDAPYAIELSGNLYLSDSYVLLINQSHGEMIISGAIGGSGTVEFRASEDCLMTVTGTNTFPNVFVQGRVRVPAIGRPGMPGPLGTGQRIGFSSSTLIYTGAGETTDRDFGFGPHGRSGIESSGTGPLVVTSSFSTSTATPTIALSGTNTDDNTWAGALDGSFAFTKDGTGTWVLAGANTHSGGTSVVAGTLKIASPGGLGAGAVTINGGTLDLLSSQPIIGYPLTVSSGAVVGAANASLRASGYAFTNTGSVAIPLTGTANLTKTGSGTATLLAANTYSGGTTVSGGTLVAGHDGAFGSGAVNILATGTVTLDHATVGNPVVVSGRLGGAGTASGQVTLNALGSIAPGDGATMLSIRSLVWNGDGRLAPKLGTGGVSDRILVTGTLARGTSGRFLVDLQGTGTAGETYTLATFDALSGFTPGDISPFGFINLPNGLTGTFALTAHALTFTVSSVAPNTAPQFVTQPTNQLALQGSSVTFTAWATGNPAPTYRWQFTTPGGDSYVDVPTNQPQNFAGATTPTLKLVSTYAAQSGFQFRCVATNGIAPAATSDVVTPTVSTPPSMPATSNATFVAGVAGSYTFTASGAPAPTFAVTAGTLPAWATLNANTGVLSGTPPDASGSPFTFTVTAANGVSPAATQTFTLAVVSMTPPVITSQPHSSTVAMGATTSFAVVATGTAPLGYQWRKDGVPVAGATGSTLTFASVQLSDAGAYSVVVSNAAGTVVSAVATLGVIPPNTSASHNAPGYVPGSFVTVRNAFIYTGTATSLTWAVVLPAGWSYVRGTGEGSVKPQAGTTDLLEWAWTDVPVSPAAFSYVLAVPAAETGVKQIAAIVTLREGQAPVAMMAQPDPMWLSPIVTHSADSDHDGMISLLELSRVIELYNTRNGTTRTGAYRVQEGTEDGFAAEPTRPLDQIFTPLPPHHADSNRDGKIGLLELTRVIELYNYRSGTRRTGQYHVQTEPPTEDGFAAGP